MDQNLIIDDGHAVQRIIVKEVAGLFAVQHIGQDAEEVLVKFFLIVRISPDHSAAFVFHVNGVEGKQGRRNRGNDFGRYDGQ